MAAIARISTRSSGRASAFTTMNDCAGSGSVKYAWATWPAGAISSALVAYTVISTTCSRSPPACRRSVRTFSIA